MSADGYVLAVDAGSGSCRAALFGLDGSPHAIAAEEWAHPTEPGVPGGRRFAADRNWELVCACIRRVLADGGARAVRAVATTSFRGGLVVYDGAGRELWAVPNSDARAGPGWAALTASARLAWLRRHEPALWRAAAGIGLINDWLVRRLTGRLITDPSVGSSSGLFDLARRSWSGDAELGVAVPEVANAGTVVGAITAAAAESTGLRAGTPVVLGGADTPLGLVGLGVCETDRCVALGGTHWQQSLPLAEPREDPDGRLRALCHVLPGQWLVEGIGFHCGLALRWLRDAFLSDVSDGYALLEREAAAARPGAGGVVALLAGEIDARAGDRPALAFTGFDLERPAETGRGAFARAILESAAYVARAHVERLEAIAGRRFDRLLLAGGVTRSRLWPQVIADVLGREIAVAARGEATIRGAALAAAVGAGAFADLAAAARAEPAPVARTLAPDAEAAATYDELYPRWRRLRA